MLQNKYKDLFTKAMRFVPTHKPLHYLKHKLSEVDIIVEVPAIVPGPPDRLCSSGGVMRMVETATHLHEMGYQVQLRIQRGVPNYSYDNLQLPIPYSIGGPNDTFPASKCVITYSDNPHQYELSELPQVKHKCAYMLSYGIHLQHEGAIVFNPNIEKICSTYNVKRRIESVGGFCKWVGFAFDTDPWYPDPTIQREARTIALMYHKGESKQFKAGWQLCAKLLKHGVIDRVLIFGVWKNKGPTIDDSRFEFFVNAGVNTLRTIYSRASLFISPSISEGLNRTPVEATLCGCPSVLMAGAIDEIFFDNTNCYVVTVNDYQSMYKRIIQVMSHDRSVQFRDHMLNVLQSYTWEEVLPRIVSVLGL
jgi:glycosyltransferase involved in cell wall biosynthesis